MRLRTFVLFLPLCQALVGLANARPVPKTKAAPPPGQVLAAVTGTWDLTIEGADGRKYPSWLHLSKDGGGAKLSMVGKVGSVFEVPGAVVEGRDLVWTTKMGTWPVTGMAYRGRRNGTLLVGTVAHDGITESWTGVRAPAWPTPKGAAAKMHAGRPVALWNGTDVGGWIPQYRDSPLGWIVRDGALDNQGKANNIYSDRKFRDFKLEIELAVAASSNSGIYLRGRHEIQVLDDAGKPPASHGNGSLYGFLTPSANASKPDGQWQTYEITVVGNRLTEVLNGTTIIDEEIIPGITGGALDSDESKPGPIMLQGDHGPVRYRKIVLTPLR